ncbi:hypothetical protein MMC25_000689 [Agyrium rufum]|nr:hypothetical protein [Agyrium rufum]
MDKFDSITKLLVGQDFIGSALLSEAVPQVPPLPWTQFTHAQQPAYCWWSVQERMRRSKLVDIRTNWGLLRQIDLWKLSFKVFRAYVESMKQGDLVIPDLLSESQYRLHQIQVAMQSKEYTAQLLDPAIMLPKPPAEGEVMKIYDLTKEQYLAWAWIEAVNISRKMERKGQTLSQVEKRLLLGRQIFEIAQEAAWQRFGLDDSDSQWLTDQMLTAVNAAIGEARECAGNFVTSLLPWADDYTAPRANPSLDPKAFGDGGQSDNRYYHECKAGSHADVAFFWMDVKEYNDLARGIAEQEL